MKRLALGVLGLGVVAAGCMELAMPRVEGAEAAGAQKAPVRPLIEIEITAGNPTTQPAALPQANRILQHAALLKQTKRVAGKVDLLFFGDALMQCWCDDTGNDVWKKNYAGLRVLNLGMASSLIENSLWRVNDGALAGLTPKVVVIHTGIHNVWTSKITPREMVEGVANLVNAVHERLPEAKILLIGIIPTGAPESRSRVTAREANKELAKFDNGDTLRFLDLTEKLAPNNGPASMEIFDERYPFLLVKKGYEIWAEAMNPVLAKMLDTPVPPATRPVEAAK